jgi:hypothetical protein
MTSVELLAGTQARVSDDYHPGNSQWKIGVSSIFASAIDIGASKDSYWSMNDPQSGHYSAGTYEPYNRLQSLVSSLSNGPVAFSDRIGFSDRELIMRCCNEDGLLLRPDRSATMIDDYFLYRSGLQTDKMKMKMKMDSGEIWSTYSVVDQNQALFKYYYVFSILLDAGLVIYPSDIDYQLMDVDGGQEWLVYEHNTTDVVLRFDASNGLMLHESKNQFEFE